jgi:transcriptional regulator with XRE-family HTH domain
VSRLRRAREGKGLSQADLARRAGVSRSAVLHAEGPTHIPVADHAAAMYRAVGLGLEDMQADAATKRERREQERHARASTVL